MGSTERITSIEANSFKRAIEEFALFYDVTDSDKYQVTSGENKLEFRYVLVNSTIQKFSLSAGVLGALKRKLSVDRLTPKSPSSN